MKGLIFVIRSGCPPILSWFDAAVTAYWNHPSKHSTWWKHLEDVFKMSFVFIFRRRLQNVFKTSWSRRTYLACSNIFRKRLQDVLIKTNIFVLVMRLQEVFKTFSRCLQGLLQKRLQDVFKRSSRRLQNIFKTSGKSIFMTSSRRLKDVFKTSSRHLARMSSRRFQGASSSWIVLVNTFSRRLRDVFKMFLRRAAKTVIYWTICLGHTSEKFMVSVPNLQEW